MTLYVTICCICYLEICRRKYIFETAVHVMDGTCKICRNGNSKTNKSSNEIKWLGNK